MARKWLYLWVHISLVLAVIGIIYELYKFYMIMGGIK